MAAIAVTPTTCADLFPNTGRVVSMETCAAPVLVLMQCWKNAEAFKAIITNVSVSSQGGFQFMHTLSNYIYLYTFNERVGEIQISGVTFVQNCSDTPQTGIAMVFSYYNKMRTTRRYAPISVTIGGLSFNAFLLGVKTGISDAATGLGSFTFNLYYPPIDTDSIGAFSADDAACLTTGLISSSSSTMTIIP